MTEADREAIVHVLNEYLDGLYHSDPTRLRRVLHPQALYATASDGTLLVRTMPEYFPIVDVRPSPASHGQAREDRIVSIDFAGPVTAIARLECVVQPRHFIDLLTMVKLDGRWWILSKVFHFDER